MKTQEDILQAIRNGKESECLDGRDFSRLVEFFPVEYWEAFGFGVKEGVQAPDPRPWTEDAIKEQLASDLAFGFEKALNQRGISASLMYSTVKMWMWVLDDPLQDHDDYAPYGLPLFKAVAVNYGLPNEIGEDNGDEHKYSSGY